MRIAMIGGARFGVEEPLAGGLEMVVVGLGRALAAEGHHVTMFAGCGTGRRSVAPRLWSEPLTDAEFSPTADARADVSMPPDRFIAEHHAYLKLSVSLRRRRFDLLHNHSLHHLPPVFDLLAPMVHTLHSPPTPWLQSAFDCAARPQDRVVSVSCANARRWGPVVHDVIPNGVDTERWRPTSTRSERVVWTGRLVPEKAPHLAIDAARAAGRPIVLAGPVHDRCYFDAQVAPRLGPDARYLGHLTTSELVPLVGGSAVAVVTPVWEEPYGLVVAEALAVGTPVAAFDRGGIQEVVDEQTGVLALPGDVAALARAISTAASLSRRACRHRAVTHCSMATMARRYLALYRQVLGEARQDDGRRGGRAMRPVAS
jgi:glycosyltransferase involved in cell wall biosynthesis